MTFFRFASFALLTVTPVLATTSAIAATPTIPTSVTSVQQVNSIFATASTAPDLGSPGSINNYPLCAVRITKLPSSTTSLLTGLFTQQICNNETISTGFVPGDYNDVRVLCGPQFRALTAGCQTATCDADEQTSKSLPFSSTAAFLTSQKRPGVSLLTQQFCGSLYNANATYSSEVSVAVASATAAATAATKGKSPLNVSDFPKCAVCPILPTTHIYLLV